MSGGTSNPDRDIVIIVIPLVVLIALLMVILGGPREFFRVLDQLVRDLVRFVTG